MNKQNRVRDIIIIVTAFIVSRLVVKMVGIDFDSSPLFSYWQYLDVTTLRENLLSGLLYDHTQPPLFNLLLGVGIKLFRSGYPAFFEVLFRLITLTNIFLLYFSLTKLSVVRPIPLIASLFYALSPATILFENELFYTNFVSMLLLLSCAGAIQLRYTINIKTCLLFFIPLIAICLTRSLYHLIWLLSVISILLACFRKARAYRMLLIFSGITLTIPLGWYIKNLVIFDNFTASSWLGMNFARNVFHDVSIDDSVSIARIEPFLKISEYEKFRSREYEQAFLGLNDNVLLAENKSDSFHNQKHVGYIPISALYEKESVHFVKSNPKTYTKNVLQSAVIFFSPATRYPANLAKAEKIKYYDLIYSLNFSYFAEGKHQNRIAIVLSAIPKAIIYIVVLIWYSLSLLKKRSTFLFLFAASTIFYVFCVSSIMEHYENMRFRYEVEPMFLIMLFCAISELVKKFQNKHNAKPLVATKSFQV